MGKDIHMFIIDHDVIVRKNIYTGRCSTWFDNLCDNGSYDEYYYLPITFGWGENVPKELKKKFSIERGYFNHYHIKVKYFLEWFVKYHPNVDAGWATTYEKWAIENKGYKPEYLPKEIPEDGNINDLHFIEYTRTDDCSEWLYHYLIDNHIDFNADIVYCFGN